MSRTAKDKYDGLEGFTEEQKERLRKVDAATKLGGASVSALNRVKEDPHSVERLKSLVSAVNAYLETSDSALRVAVGDGAAVHGKPVKK